MQISMPGKAEREGKMIRLALVWLREIVGRLMGRSRAMRALWRGPTVDRYGLSLIFCLCLIVDWEQPRESCKKMTVHWNQWKELYELSLNPGCTALDTGWWVGTWKLLQKESLSFENFFFFFFLSKCCNFISITQTNLTCRKCKCNIIVKIAQNQTF